MKHKNTDIYDYKEASVPTTERRCFQCANMFGLDHEGKLGAYCHLESRYVCAALGTCGCFVEMQPFIPYNGEYEKTSYFVRLKTGVVWGPCWPNAGKFNLLNGTGDVIEEEDIDSIRRTCLYPNEV